MQDIVNLNRAAFAAPKRTSQDYLMAAEENLREPKDTFAPGTNDVFSELRSYLHLAMAGERAEMLRRL